MRLKIVSLLTAMALASPMLAKPYPLSSSLSCEERAEVVLRLGEGTQVGSSTAAVNIGGEFDLHWSRGRFPEREPVFLMIAFEGHVRVQGDSAYVLNENAIAPFEIPWAQEKTRVVIPFFGRGSPKSAKIKVKPLNVGSLRYSWRVVGHSGCDVVLASANETAEVQVKVAGHPRIVVSDPETLVVPTRTYLSAMGTRRLDIFADHFQLVDTASGAEVLEGAGTNVIFSPTGRFVQIRGGQNGGVYDAVDGAKISDAGGATGVFTGTLLWANHDSFVISTPGAWGISSFGNLLSGRQWPRLTESCRGCDAMDSAQIGLDLENNVILTTDHAAAAAFSLTNGRSTSAIARDRLAKDQIASVLNWVRKNTGVLPAQVPQWRDFSGGLTFETGFLSDPHGRDHASTQDHWNDIRAVPVFEQITPVTPIAATATESAEAKVASTATNWRMRGLARTRNFVTTGQIIARLGEFGIDVLEPITINEAAIPDYPNRDASDSEQAAAQRRIAEAQADIVNRISADTGADPNNFKPMSFNNCGYGPEFIANPDRAWRWKRNGVVYWVSHAFCNEGMAAFISSDTELFSSAVGGQVQFPFDSYEGDTFDNPTTDIATTCDSALDACGFELSVMGDLMLLYSPEGKAFALYDYIKNQMVIKRFNLPRGDVFENALLLRDGKHVVTLQADGTFFILRISDGKELIQGRYADDEIVVWTPEGRFDATAEGAHFVAFTFPGRSGEYAFQLFENRLKVPGLLELALNDKLPSTPVTISAPPALSANVTTNDGQLQITATATGPNVIQTLSVFQDGLLTDRVVPTYQDEDAVWRVDVDRRPGTRWINLVATDEAEVSSLPLAVEIDVAGVRRTRILSIGVDQYDLSLTDAVPNLFSAVSDASLIAETLSSLSVEGQEILSPVLLTDHEATPARIMSELEKAIHSSQPGDTLAVFFAGHGVTDEKGEFYLAPSKLDVGDIPATGLAFSRISDLLSQAEDVRVVVFLDACHSGLAGQGLFATNDEVSDSVLDAVPSGVVVFSAAKGREFALENSARGGGLFANAVARVVGQEREAYDRNGNGAIEASELFLGVKESVLQDVSTLAQNSGSGVTDQRQTPWMARNRMTGDFALF